MYSGKSPFLHIGGGGRNSGNSPADHFSSAQPQFAAVVVKWGVEGA